MELASESLEFERANSFKEKLGLLDMFKTKSTVVSHTITNVDVFSGVLTEKSAFINYLKVINGMVVRAKSVEYKLKLSESIEDVLESAIPKIRHLYESESKELILPVPC